MTINNDKNLDLIDDFLNNLSSPAKKSTAVKRTRKEMENTAASLPLFESPEKWYPLTKKDGSWKFELSPTPSKVSGVYGIKNQKSGEYLIGETGRTIKKRMGEYQTQINHPEKYSGPLLDAVREGDAPFAMGILFPTEKEKESDPNQLSLKSLETLAIIKKNSVEKGYNQNYGGGGGVPDQTSSTILNAPLNFDASVHFPKKLYPLSYTKEKKFLLRLPEQIAHLSNVIYVFVKTKKLSEFLISPKLIGETQTKISSRISGYISSFNRSSDTEEEGALVKAVRKSPEKFSFAILYQIAEKIHPKALEILFIDYYRDEIKCKLYNQRRGGGGGSAAAQC